MRLIGNLLWFVLGGGFFAWLGWLLVAAVLALTVIGFPWAVAAYRISGFAAFPFGRELVDAEYVGERRIPLTGLANALWIVLAGIWLTIGHLLAAVAYFISLIGIPFGIAHMKLASVSFAPLGKRVMTR